MTGANSPNGPSRPRWVRGLWPAAAVAVLGALLLATPDTWTLDREVGLTLLYAMRGEREPPHDVCIVAIDGRAASALGLPPDPKDWPRRLHAQLLPYLSGAGARVVAFDLLFASTRNEREDALLAQAIAQAGNVVLAAQLDRDTEPPRGSRQQFAMESYVEPLPALAGAALGVAPVVFPKTPRIDLFWTFKEEGYETATLPAVVMQAFARDAYPALRAGLPASAELPMRLEANRLERTVWKLREALAHSAAARAAPAGEPGRLISMYRGASVRMLNFYGGPSHIRTYAYDRVLAAARGDAGVEPMDFAGKAVLVGMSELAQTRQRDNYHTVYTREDGVDLSGVEIAATAVANLRDGSSLRVPGWPALAALVAGSFLLAFALRLLPVTGAAILAIATAALYLLLARWQFASAFTWWPVLVPLGMQLPAAFGLGLLLQYRDVRRERDSMRRLLGIPAPNHALDQLARNLGPLPNRQGLVFSTCLIGDIESYTKISEQLGPAPLLRLMNRYFETVFPPIQRNRGVVIDNIGDAMQAVWLSARSDPALRSQALQAGLDVQSALREFNASDDHPPMNVRLGLHCGEVAFGPWGAEGRVENRIVGDIVNTAARIQALNKDMGTRLLASGQTLAQLPDWVARPVGRFRLVGREATLEIFQPLGVAGQANDEQRWLAHSARDALAEFVAGRFDRAQRLWQAVLDRHPDDGPARYHLDLCRRMAAEPPSDWDGTIRQTRK